MTIDETSVSAEGRDGPAFGSAASSAVGGADGLDGAEAGSRVYLICPVRGCSDEDRSFADEYVARIERGGATVHYPPRDVDQTDDGIGLTISEAHREAMLECDEVHVIWDPTSSGSHFDFGMAFMLRAFKDVRFVLARPIDRAPQKGHGNKLLALAAADAAGVRRDE